MRYLGVPLLLLGLSIGLFLYWPSGIEAGRNHETVKQEQAQLGASHLPGAAPDPLPQFTREATLKWPPSSTGIETKPTNTNTRAGFAVKPAAKVVTKADTGWRPTKVKNLRPTRPSLQPELLTSKDRPSRYKLVVDIQRTLKLRGCYSGRIDGSWGASSQSAMQTYLDRINSELPLGNPDPVLLAALQSDVNARCDGCAAGEVRTSGGHCSPIVSDAAPPYQPVGSQAYEGRMAIGGPRDLPPVGPNGDGAWSGESWASSGDAMGDDGFEPVAVNADVKPTPAWKQKKSDVQASRERNLMMSLGGGF